jgi:hypothetical protein
VESRLHPTDLVSVAFFSLHHGAVTVLSFTSDHSQVLRVLDGLALLLGSREVPSSVEATGRPGDPLRLTAGDWQVVLAEVGAAAGIEMGTAEEAFAMIGRQGGDTSGGFLMRNILYHMSQIQRAEVLERHSGYVANLAESMRDIVEGTAGLRGRKYLLLFSGGFEPETLSGREDSSFESPEGGGAWVLAELEETLGAFRREGWTVYSIALGGTRAIPGFQEGLFYLANETGGTLVERTNDLASGLEDVLDRTETAYLLSVRARTDPGDARPGSLEVRLKGVKGRHQVVHRTSFALATSAPIQARLAQLLASGASPAGASDAADVTPLPIAAVSEPGRVTVRIGLGAEHLADRRDDGSVGIELYLYAFDPDERVAGFATKLVPIDREQIERAAGTGGVALALPLDLPPGSFEIRCAVRNVESRLIGLGSAQVTVPAG